VTRHRASFFLGIKRLDVRALQSGHKDPEKYMKKLADAEVKLKK
jgi:hypothetical protein